MEHTPKTAADTNAQVGMGQTQAHYAMSQEQQWKLIKEQAGKIHALEATITTLTEALVKSGDHNEDCRWVGGDGPCSCGYEALTSIIMFSNAAEIDDLARTLAEAWPDSPELREPCGGCFKCIEHRDPLNCPYFDPIISMNKAIMAARKRNIFLYDFSYDEVKDTWKWPGTQRWIDGEAWGFKDFIGEGPDPEHALYDALVKAVGEST
jgi:hypothetical protein